MRPAFAFAWAPEEVLHLQFAGGVAPWRGAAHQGVEFALRGTVVEALAEEVAVVAQDDGLTEDQRRVFVGRCGGEAGVDGQGAERDLHCGEFGAVGQFVTVARIESAHQGQRAGGEEKDAGRGPRPSRPAGEEVGPEKREEREVAPKDELGVVPRPRGHEEKKAEGERGESDTVENAGGAVCAAATEQDRGTGDDQWQEDTEIPRPEPEPGFLLHPTGRKAQRGRRGEADRDQADQPSRGNQTDYAGDKKRAHQSFFPCGHRAAGEECAEEKKSGRVEERHRGVERDLREDGEFGSIGVTAQLGAPDGHEHQSGGQRVEQAALRDEHGEEGVFPCHVVEHSVEGAGLDEGDRAESAGEKEGGHGEAAAPAPEGGSRSGGAEEPGPAESFVNGHAGDAQNGVPQIHARVVGKDGAGEERVFRPKRAAVGKAVDEVEVQGHVAEVVRRENFEVGALRVDDPEKGAPGGEGEDEEEDAVGEGDFLARGGGGARGEDSGECAEGEGDRAGERREFAAQRREAGGRDGRDGDEDEAAAEQTPTDHGSPLRGRR